MSTGVGDTKKNKKRKDYLSLGRPDRGTKKEDWKETRRFDSRRMSEARHKRRRRKKRAGDLILRTKKIVRRGSLDLHESARPLGIKHRLNKEIPLSAVFKPFVALRPRENSEEFYNSNFGFAVQIGFRDMHVQRKK